MNDRCFSILIVDDEPAIIDALEPVLTASGYAVLCAATATAGARAIATTPIDVVLLDLGLPDGDGRQLIGPAIASGAAVIVISARHLEQDKIEALDLGADDFVDKPFKIGVLLARLRAALRRRGDVKPYLPYVNGLLTIDVTAHLVSLGAETVRLSPKEWALMATLVASAGQVVTHKRLLLAGWGSATGDTRYLRIYISLLRQKLEADPSDPVLLLTEPGLGYRLAAAPVHPDTI